MFYQNLPPHPSPGPMYTLEFEIPESRAMLGPRHLGTRLWDGSPEVRLHL